MDSGQPALVPITETPFNAETPWAALRAERTPAECFYVRSHFDVPPTVAGGFSLPVVGEVEEPAALSLSDLRRLGASVLDVTLECAGNGRASLDPRVDGTPWGFGAVGTARFEGVPLADVLAAVRPRATAVEVLFTGADSGATKAGGTEAYARSLPLDAARGRDVLLAWGMNGAPLPRAHGFPLRLVVPGWYGMASVKWLREVRLIAAPFRGFFQAGDYVFRERDGTLDGTPVTLMAPRALLVAPLPGARLEAPIEAEGIAWSGGGGVVRVEVSADAGRTWRDATLGPSSSPYAARSFRTTVPAAPGPATLVARATDAAGAVQPERSVWNRLGYENSGWHRVEVLVG